MAVNAAWIMEAMERWAPRHLAESWDNVGLLVGHPAAKVSKVLVTLDVTIPVVTYAAQNKYDLIISHHPPIFKALPSLRTDNSQGQMLALLLQNSIAVYTAHTNLDAAPGGVNDTLATLLGLKRIRPLQTTYEDKLVKLAVFVPASHVGAVCDALCDAGAGHIGQYSHCTWQSAGTGTFLPLAGTNPFLGTQGQLQSVNEVKLETIFPQSLQKAVIAAMIAAHPYEEVAYDLYHLMNTGKRYGIGRIGTLPAPCSFGEWLRDAKEALGLETVKVAGSVDREIQTIALCGGSGASMINDAAQAGADVLITGDVKYHEAQQAIDKGIIVIDGGHYGTEQPVVQVVSAYLRQAAALAGEQLIIDSDPVNTDVFYYR